jgi:cis-3-alkyl-4-acyloxetan-2-one decarboxylase
LSATEPKQFDPAPDLPPWLREELPWSRRVFRNGSHTVHFVDQGQGPVVVLQHGNPTWCYLWRKVIRLLLAQGVRVVAPDLIGLGLSDKPADAAVHTLAFHAAQIGDLLEALDVGEITIVGQDWGGPVLGLVAAQKRVLVRGAVFANTSLSVPRHIRQTAFHRLANVPLISDLFFRVLNLPIEWMPLVQGDRSSIGAQQRRAYRYPLASFRDRVAPLALARMVPATLSHPTIGPLALVEEWGRSFAGPVDLVWGTRDPIMGSALKGARRLFPRATVVETQAGHFLQEEVPEVLAEAILGNLARR